MTTDLGLSKSHFRGEPPKCADARTSERRSDSTPRSRTSLAHMARECARIRTTREAERMPKVRPTDPPDEPRFVLPLKGDRFTIEFGGVEITLKDTQGL